MKITALCVSFFVSVLSLANVATAQGPQGQAREALLRAFPGLEIREVNGRVRQIYGVPMTRGETARAAVATWMESYSGVLTGQTLDLVEYSQVKTKSGKTMLRYTQRIGQAPVKGSMVVAVTTGDEKHQVVTYIACRLADSPSEPFPQPAISGKQAVKSARSQPTAAALTMWREPELIARFDEREGSAVGSLAWRCIGAGGEETFDSRTYYVDPANGDVVLDSSNGVQAAANPTRSPAIRHPRVRTGVAR